MVMFLLLVFLFVVRPLLRWLTTSSGPKQGVLMQLPKTLSEIESEYGASAPKKDEAVKMITSDEENSLKLMKQWLGDEKV